MEIAHEHENLLQLTFNNRFHFDKIVFHLYFTEVFLFVPNGYDNGWYV